MQIPPPGESAPQNSFIVSDTPLPALHVNGELAAIDRSTQQVLWLRDVDNCSILHFPELRLPVLVTAARIRHASQLALRLEIIDARTGKTSRAVEPEVPHDGPPADPLVHDSDAQHREPVLREEPAAVHDRLLADRLLQYNYHRQSRTLELHTTKSTIRVELAVRP